MTMVMITTFDTDALRQHDTGHYIQSMEFLSQCTDVHLGCWIVIPMVLIVESHVVMFQLSV